MWFFLFVMIIVVLIGKDWKKEIDVIVFLNCKIRFI